MDFLTFNSFLSIPVLIGFYYLGAIVCPFVMWRCMKWLLKRYPWAADLHAQGKSIVWQQLPSDKKWKVVLLFVAMFLMAEIFWRMLFEYLIAFMQMHDALVH
jgi:hypothetical protein